MKITWVLPQNYDVPIGGYKVVYQYANYLCSHGNDIRIVFLQNPNYLKKGNLYRFIRYMYWEMFHKNPFKKKVTWFPLDSRIDIDWNVTPKQVNFKKNEKIIATAYWTANFVNLIDVPQENKFYFLQDYELFSGNVDEVDETWRLPLNKFSVSSWLSELGEKKFGQKVKVIPNFLDAKDDFKITNSLNNRNCTIALLNHPSERKNTKLGLEIIRLVKEKIPNVTVKLFGTEDFDTSKFDYIEYFKRPSRKQLRDEIYNQSVIYLLPSKYEGWGLTAMEAMASGDIVVSNDNGGVNDFIKNNVNGYIIDFNKTQLVLNKIIEILTTENHQLAINASRIIDEFSVEKSSEILLNYLYRN